MLTKRSLLRQRDRVRAGGNCGGAWGRGLRRSCTGSTRLAAGGVLCDASAVQVLVAEGPARVLDLAEAGARFDLDASGRIALGREAAHSRKRIVHAQGTRRVPKSRAR